MRKKIEITTDEEPNILHTEEETLPDASTPSGEGETSEAKAAAESATGRTGGRATKDTGAEDYITALQADLSEARGQVEDLEKRLLYAQAEFQNFRRRKEDEFKDLQRFANSELIRTLLPIMDNFDRALQAAEQTRNFDALVGGVSGTRKQLQAALQKVGVTPIEAVGKEFDPNFHEAIGHMETDDYPPNTVAEEVQRGYLIHDRVLRPTLVKVAQ
ncbi:MAG TPA: nucleotide exchange factor GrpE [Chthonomonadaceae bacterium]|nr:nucleotide exchange factor GrpE [Chthonomonadaceae bacterium]